MTELTINSQPFTRIQGIEYKHDYLALSKIPEQKSVWPELFPDVKDLTKGYVEKQILRHLILNDLWFIVYFILGIPTANHPFVVNFAKKIEEGADTKTLDIVARGHFKSSIITKAETIQYHLKYPERCTAIFSYKKPLGEKFLASIKQAYESDFLKNLFPEILYSNPEHDSPSWSLQNGITINRKGKTRTEATVFASGLSEGMATGMHVERRIYDDVETFDMSGSPDVMADVFDKFQFSSFLGTKTDKDVERIIGTFYHWEGPLAKISRLRTHDDKYIYNTRIIPGTHDGQPNGNPVFWSQEILDEEKTKSGYFSQILCNPVPQTERRLNPEFLQVIAHNKIPKDCYRFMMVDPAGSEGGGDSWAIILCGVQPKRDELGASNVYILDASIEPFKQSEAIESIIRMYINGGSILKLGVEKVGQSTAEIHVAQALQARGRRVSVDNGSLEILKPAGRKKHDRIAAALEWPLNNQKLFISSNVPQKYIDKIKMEMDKFPYGSDDAMDSFSYVYDMIKNYRFPHNGEERVFTRATVSVASSAGY